MGDLDNKTLANKLEAFMEQMTVRQRALEEQMASLSVSVQGARKEGNREHLEGQSSQHGKEGSLEEKKGV